MIYRVLLTAEAQRSQRKNICCLSGDNDKQHAMQPLWGNLLAAGLRWFCPIGFSSPRRGLYEAGDWLDKKGFLSVLCVSVVNYH